MFCDHIHQMFFFIGDLTWLNMLGRPVFVLFLFCSAEAFHYTRSKKKYILRTGIAAAIMTLVFAVVSILLPNNHNVELMNNAFATFCVAAIWMLAWDNFKSGALEKKAKKFFAGLGILLIPVLTALPSILVLQFTQQPDGTISTTGQVLLAFSMAIPNFMMIEGGVLMALLGTVFYVFRSMQKLDDKVFLSRPLWLWVQVVLLFAMSAYSFVVGHTNNDIQWMMAFAAIPMLMYNGERGKGMKNFFYVFYPAHIIMLYLVSTLVFK